MTQSKPVIEDVADDTLIWRYMDFARFTALAFSHRLWFPKLRELWLDDPWEGFGRVRGLRRPSRRQRSLPATETARLLIAEASAYAAKTVRNAPEHVYASSWCRGSETLGMWERYGAAGRGIALESSVGQFKQALERKLKREQYAFGLVRYSGDLQTSASWHSDFTKGSIPLSGPLWQRTLSAAFTKRGFYEDENEWRAAVFQEQKRPDTKGLLMPIDLNILIRTVRVGPRVDAPTIVALQAVMKAAGVDRPIEESTIFREPRRRRRVDPQTFLTIE